MLKELAGTEFSAFAHFLPSALSQSVIIYAKKSFDF